ncbi:MAG TPA: threonine synthase [bacterium]|jgi:threonine synthase|nr:threonine synthase [bacterium]
MGLIGLQCRECGTEYPIEPLYVCERCLGPLETVYDYAAIDGGRFRQAAEGGPRSIWRYAALLPAERVSAFDLAPGFTPLQPASRLAQVLGLRRLYLKNDTLNPTWSFKDRVVAVAIAAAHRFGFDVVACASTGNLANAVAAHAARAGLRAFVFIPRGLEHGKIVTSGVYAPTVVEVEGNYDDVNRLCAEIADEYRWAFVNVNLRPYYAEGGKTLGFEVAEQLHWQAPDHVVVPVASGSLMVKIHKGLTELHRLGILPGVPTRVHGAQASGCAPVAEAFAAGANSITPVKPQTIARSLAIGSPADGRYALGVARNTGGTISSVTDREIVDAIRLLAETEGIFTETAGGVTVGVLRALAEAGQFGADDTVVAYITGMGLKTLEAIEPEVRAPLAIQPTLKDFERVVVDKVV